MQNSKRELALDARGEPIVDSRVAANRVKPRAKTKIVGFDPVLLRAPFVLRCAALIIDYLFVMTAPVVGLLIAASSNERGVKLLNNSANTVGWLVAVLLVLTNFVILPVAFGRTLGKALTGLQIVGRDGDNLTFNAALVRHLIGYPLTLLTGGLGFLIAAFNLQGKALHDYLASSIVIQARRKQLNVDSK